MKKLLSIALCICLTLAVVFVAAPSFNKANADTTADAQALLEAYDNGGNYIKDTEIFTDLSGEDYFHAGADELVRRTTYTPGRLYMSGEGINGGYKDVGSDMHRFHLDGEGNDVYDFTVYNTSVEEYFTDLAEMATIGTWTLVDGKYETAVTTEWVHFVAPMWIGDIANLTKVVMFKGAGLVLQLWSADTMFAQATITVPAASGWQLVTDASTLKAGDQIVIVAKDYNYALSTTQNTNNRAQAAVTKNDDTITFGGDVQIITLEAGTVDGTFAFNVGDGYLYAASSESNHLKKTETLDDDGSWLISIVNSVATIKAQGENTRNWLRYNSTNNPPIFSSYGSGQADVCIYKNNTVCKHLLTTEEIQDPECEIAGTTTVTCDVCGLVLENHQHAAATGHVNTSEVTINSTCTTPGSTTVTCDDCGATISTTVIDAKHNYVDGTCSVCGQADPNAGVNYVEKEYTYTFTAKQYTANGTKTLNGISWTLAGNGGNYWGYDGTKGQQFGSGSAAYKSMTLTSSEFTRVKKIIINTSGAKSISGSFVVTVGGTQVGAKTSLTTTATAYTFTADTALDGVIVFTYTQTSSKAIYIKSITVVYEVAA